MGSAKHLFIRNTDPDADSYANTNPDSNADPNAGSDTDTDTDAYSGTADLPFRPSCNDTMSVFAADVAAVERQVPLRVENVNE